MSKHIYECHHITNVANKKLTISITIDGWRGGVLVASFNNSYEKRITVIACVGYSVSLIASSNANLFTNSSVDVSGNTNYGIVITVTADQITTNDVFTGTVSLIG